jgi:hypothetical protein
MTSNTITIESWFISFDIIMIMCTTLVIILATLFLLIIVLDKTCHTIPMMLIANSCLAELLSGSGMLSMVVFTLQNDLKQIQYEDSCCIFRGYLAYVIGALQNYSYVLPAVYRYITIVYPTHLFWRSARMQLLFIGLTWILAFVCPVAFIFNGEIIYNVDNQICQISLQWSFSLLYGALYSYIIPISMIMYIYWRLCRYVKDMSKRVTVANTLSRAQRELKMVRRIVILVMGVTIIGFPYVLLILMSFFNRAPKYDLRIAFFCIDLSMVFIMIALFQFTDPLKSSVMKRIKWRPNVIVATVA